MEIMGRLTRDADLRSLPDGRQVVHFTLAVNDSYKSKDRQTLIKQACFFDCSYWRNTSLAPYLTTGSLVEVNGQLSVWAWTNTEGQAKTNLQVHVNSLKLHGKTGTPSVSLTQSSAASLYHSLSAYNILSYLAIQHLRIILCRF